MKGQNKTLSKRRRKAAEKFEKKLFARVASLQRELYIFTLEAVGGLSVGSDGRIKDTTANFAKVEMVSLGLTLGEKGETLGQWIARRVAELLGLTRKYFRSVIGKKNVSVEDKVRKKIMRRLGYDPDAKTLIEGRYLWNLVNDTGVAKRAATLINDAIANRVSIDVFRDNLRDVMVNPEGLGQLERHFNTFSRDLFHGVDRLIGKQYAEDLGLKYAIYGGTAKDNTREFCLERLNRVYTREEIESWNDLDWPGKKPNHDIFQCLGGYNCRHQLDWLSNELGKTLYDQQNN